VVLQIDDGRSSLRGIALRGGQCVLGALAFIEDDNAVFAELFD